MNSKPSSRFKLQSRQKQNQPSTQDSNNIASNNTQQNFSRILKRNSCDYPLTTHKQTGLKEQDSNQIQSMIKKKLGNVIQFDWVPSKGRNIRHANKKDGGPVIDEDRLSISSYKSYIDSSQVTKKKPRFSRSSFFHKADLGITTNFETPQLQKTQNITEQLKLKRLEEQLKSMKIELDTKTRMVAELSNDVQLQSKRIQELQESKNKEMSEKQNEISELEIDLRVLRHDYMHINNSLYALEDVLARYKDQNARIKSNESKLLLERKKLKQRVENLCRILTEQEKKRVYASKRDHDSGKSCMVSHTSKNQVLKVVPSKFTKQLELPFSSEINYSPKNRKSITQLSSSFLQISPD